MSYWIKLWTEILDDPKMGQLPDHLWRRVVEMFLFAGKIDGDGCLPPVEDMAWTLHVTPATLEADLDALAQLSRPIIAKSDHGWIVCQFADRQAPVSNAERQRRHREQSRQGNETVTNRDSSVTENVTTVRDNTVTQSESESESESEQKRTEPESAADGAPSGASPSPICFEGWIASLQPKSANKHAILQQMHETLFPGRDPPDYGYIGKTARDVGGAGRLAELMWQASTRPPVGDIMAYCLGVYKKEKNRNGNGRRDRSREVGEGVTKPEDYITGEYAEFVEH